MMTRLRHCIPHFVMLLVSVALYAAAMRIDAGASAAGRIGPDFWPKAIIVFMGLLCAYEIVKRAVFGVEFDASGLVSTARPGEAAEAEAPAEEPEREYPLKLLGGAALIVGYVAVITWLGFFTTTGLFLFAFSWLGGFRRHGWNALVALLGALLMVVLFMRVAYISLPLGEGPFRSVSIALMHLLGIN